MHFQDVKVYKAERGDCRCVSRLHIISLDRGFLGTLGQGFLTLFYEFLLERDEGIFLVAKQGNDIRGFIAGTVDRGKLLSDFIRRKGLKAGFLILPKLFTKNIIKGIVEILKHKEGSINTLLPEAELLSISVEKDFRKRGVATILFKGLVEIMESYRIKAFKVIVGSDLKEAVNFYEKMGCRKIGITEVHKNKSSEVMVFELKDRLT